MFHDGTVLLMGNFYANDNWFIPLVNCIQHTVLEYHSCAC